MEKQERKYSITVEYDKFASSHQTFRAIAELMLAIDELNNAIATTFSEEIETEAVIEEITPGSINIWLIDKLKSLPDDKIKAYVKNPREAIADFLIKTKHRIIKALDEEPKKINQKAPEILVEEIQKSELKQVGYTIHKTKLLESLSDLSKSVKNFDYKPVIEIEGEKMLIVDNYSFNPEEIEDIQKKTHTIRDKFIIKKPDLIGNSKWTIIFDKNIDVKIRDEEFLKRIHNREISIAFGDMLDAELKIETFLDPVDMSVIETRYTITKVYGIVPPTNKAKQPKLKGIE